MIPPMPHDLPEPRLKPNTEVVLQKRYLHKKADGSTETPRDLFWRVSSAIAAEEAKYERSPFTVDDLARRFYDLMTSWRFLPNSPTLMNAASELGQLSACFVLPVGDSIEEIFDAVKFAAMIHKSGGGTGFSFSRLRPKASRVGSTGGVASGPVSFLRIFNTATEQIKQGGTRRGANMGILRVDHPDIVEFIRAKEKEGEFNNFNLSVGLTEAFMQAVEQENLHFVGDPKIDLEDKITKDGYTFTAVVALYPEVTLGQYKGLSATRPVVTVTDEDVDKRLQELADRNSRLVSVDRAVKKGDTADIDFEGFDNGKAFDGGKGENFDLEIGSGSFVPGFEDQLIGMKAGEEKDIDITFPENYTPELAGKPVVFHVKINEVKVKEVPTIDDEFAKDVSEFDTLKDLKADIKKKMTVERTEAAQRAFEDVLMAKVAESVEAEIPTEMVELQAAQMTEGFKQQLASQGIPFDQYLKMTNTTEADFTKQAYGPAEQQVKMDLAVKAIIDAEKLDATDDEVEAEMKNVADKYGMDLDTVKKYLRPEEVKEQVIREKVIKVVADSAKAVAPAEEKAELEAEGEIVEKPAKKPAAKKTTKKAEGEEKAEKAPAKKPAAKKTAKKDAE